MAKRDEGAQRGRRKEPQKRKEKIMDRKRGTTEEEREGYGKEEESKNEGGGRKGRTNMALEPKDEGQEHDKEGNDRREGNKLKD